MNRPAHKTDLSKHTKNECFYPLVFTGKEKDSETGYYNFGARYYDSDLSGLFLSVDPMADKYPSLSPYAYCAWNPVKLVDPDGEEPVKMYTGTVSDFVLFFNNTATKMGTLTGTDAHNAMIRLGNTKVNGIKVVPATTAPFNKCKGRYIYTKKGGWIDMSHFMFYAGRAYQHKMSGEEYPVGKALKEGLCQEMTDLLFSEHSAFSYEDLPSDKFGAEFGANYFDPNSSKDFGTQLKDYMENVLKATSPQEAPNFDSLPMKDSKNPPSESNMSSYPKYTSE